MTATEPNLRWLRPNTRKFGQLFALICFGRRRPSNQPIAAASLLAQGDAMISIDQGLFAAASIQIARDQFPGAGSILAMLSICR
jgi:hypothetical protein